MQDFKEHTDIEDKLHEVCERLQAKAKAFNILLNKEIKFVEIHCGTKSTGYYNIDTEYNFSRKDVETFKKALEVEK